MYWFAVVTFRVDDFRNQYALDDHIECNSLLGCMKSHLAYGLMNPPSWISHGFPIDGAPDYYQLTLTVLYTLFVNLIFTAIVSGIIIDSFGEMRDQMNEIRQDARGRCFICHIEKDRFDQYGNNSFEQHVKHEHNMWHYIWFMIHLEDIEDSEYTGLEHYVKGLLDSKQIDFFPINRAKILDHEEADAENEIIEKVQDLEARFDTFAGKTAQTLDELSEECKKLQKGQE
eukprot:CAMPEP_0117867422 /NCGR_PEP_ID=MMETSP0950-20121206/7965_1 /TAXON_ID=44440 /ORGANISM="Chattonella subsalsa, Strain CCMP2191" /LENGTH=228 /DNA_ID=CAMNT_0005718975 /DNA_START=255 /DNA_END=942 /DNA_ORIENTATION=+